MHQDIIKKYCEAYKLNHFEEMRFCYNQIQNQANRISPEKLSDFFKDFSTQLAQEDSVFVNKIFGNIFFDINIFIKKLNDLVFTFTAENQVQFFYNFFLYPPDLILKIIYTYNPYEILELNHYPISKFDCQINIPLNDKNGQEILFYISNPYTNFQDVYLGRAMPYNGNLEDNLYDYHLPLPYLLQYYLNDCKIQITSDYNEIGNQKYLYTLTFKNIHAFFEKHDEAFFEIIPQNVLNDLNKGKCILIFNSLHEVYDVASYFHVIEKAISKNLNKTGKENFIILTGNNYDVVAHDKLKRKIPNISQNTFSTLRNYKSTITNSSDFSAIQLKTFDFFEEAMAFQYRIFHKDFSYQSKMNAFEKSEIKLHFLCLNRVVKDFRLATSYLFYKNNLLEKSAISQGVVTDNSILESSIIKSLKSDDFDMFLNSLPYHLDSHSLTPNFWNIVPEETINKSFVWVVTETLFGDKSNSIKNPFITEKTYKPIMFFMPFVMIGNYRMLNDLKKKGYKTFNNWWDESYDEEPNPIKRLKKVFDTLHYIATFTPNQMITTLHEMKDVLVHNHTVLLSQNSGKHLAHDLKKMMK